jgi:hypothetical protein
MKNFQLIGLIDNLCAEIECLQIVKFNQNVALDFKKSENFSTLNIFRQKNIGNYIFIYHRNKE